MIFRELILQNFGPYRGRQTIDLRPQTQDNLRPIILLGGMNGGGKTTLMDAIRLALYGHRAQCSTRGNLSYADFLTQAVNRNTPLGEKTRIELAFEHIHNHELVEIRISRQWTVNPKDGKDTLGVLVQDWPDPTLVKTWDEFIENLLPLGISNLFLFDGEQVKELAELDAPPPQVTEAIQSLLGLELAERLAVDLDILVNRKRKALASAKDLANLDEIEVKLTQQKAAKTVATQERAQLAGKLKRAKEKYKEAYDKFVSEGGKIAAQRSQLEQKIRDRTQAAQSKREELCALAAGVLPLALILPLLKKAHTQGEKEIKRQEAMVTREVLKQRDRRLLDFLQTLALTDTKIEKIQSFLDQENQELEETINLQEEPWLLADPETLKHLATLESYQIPTQLDLAQQKLSELKTIEAELDSVERQLAIAAAPETYEKLEKALKKAQDDKLELQVAYETAQRKYEEIESAIAQTRKELERYSEETIDRRNSEHIIQSVARVQNTLKRFKERLTLKKLNKLETEVTECFRYLLHKSDLVHRLSIDTQTFALSLFDPSGQPVPKHRLSAGEKQLLAIAFLWGLARVSGRQLPVAIDTPLGRLDSSHRYNLVERYFPSASHQVILLSTDTEIAKTEYEQLQKQDAIAREYLLSYDSAAGQTTVKPGYFWSPTN